MNPFLKLILLLLLPFCSLAQNDQKKDIMESGCKCLNTALDREREKGFNYVKAYDRCMAEMETNLLKYDKTFSNAGEFDKFLTGNFDKFCNRYYRAQLMRSTLGSYSFQSFDTITNATPPPANMWLHYAGLSDAGTNMEVKIRFLSRDTFEFETQLMCPACADSCDLYTNDIAHYVKKGSKLYLRLKPPRRVDRFFDWNGPWENGKSEVEFYFSDNRDHTKGIYVELKRYRTVGKDIRNACQQDAVITPLKYTGTSLFTGSPYAKRKDIRNKACSCISEAVSLEKKSKYEFVDNYKACVDSLKARLQRLDEKYKRKEPLDNFFLRELGDKCHGKEVDSIKLVYYRYNFPLRASPEECELMKTGVFVTLGDADSAKIYMSEKKQIIKYKDGTYTKSKIEWLGTDSFKLIRGKSTHVDNSKMEPENETVFRILKVKEGKIVYYEEIVKYSHYLGKLVKIGG